MDITLSFKPDGTVVAILWEDGDESYSGEGYTAREALCNLGAEIDKAKGK